MKKKICVVTGTRAEYGLFKPLLDLIKNEVEFELQIIATGMHLSGEFGFTYQQIEKDGFTINEKLDIQLTSDTAAGISKSMGLAMIGFGEAYQKLKPGMVLLLGDRFETFCAASAAVVARIPVCHLHGGELTEGAMDDSFRHSITKMSYLHFTSTEEYRRRVIQLGEAPERVFNTGAIGLDNIRKLKLLKREELENEIGFSLSGRFFLVTFHPVTLENNTAETQFRILLNVLDRHPDIRLIFTKANADTDGRIINRMIDDYALINRNRAIAFTSMGQLRYLSAMQYADAVVGNSSSGIIEAPSFKIGTINIGDRQKGRIKPGSVIDCEPDQNSIENAVGKLYSLAFQGNLKNISSPYGDGYAADKIMKILLDQPPNFDLKKKFFDIPFTL